MKVIGVALLMALLLLVAMASPALASGPGADGLGRCPAMLGQDGHNWVPAQAHHATGGGTPGITFHPVIVP